MKKNKPFLKIIISLVIAVLLFIVLLLTEKSMLSDYDKITVVVAKQDIPEGIEITNENYNQYFTTCEVNKEVNSEGIVKNITKKEKVQNDTTNKENKTIETCVLDGCITTTNIYKNEIIYEKDFVSTNDLLDGIEVPTEVTFSVNSIDAALGGSIRPGQLVDITVYSDKKEASFYILKNAYIYKAMDESGKLISNDDTETSATMFTIIVDRDFAREFYAALNIGDVSIAWPSEPGKYTEYTNSDLFMLDDSLYTLYYPENSNNDEYSESNESLVDESESEAENNESDEYEDTSEDE